MLLAIKNPRPDGGTFVELSGTAEGQDLVKLIGFVEGPLVINCSGITRINSVGIRRWLIYFNNANEPRNNVKLEEVSLALVEQLNMFQNFMGQAEITSVMAPYLCNNCKNKYQEKVCIFKLDVSKIAKSPSICPKCSGQGKFDDDPDLYFRFLKK